MKMKLRKAMVFLLIVTFLASVVLYTDSLGSFNTFSSGNKFIEDFWNITFGGEIKPHNLLHQESSTTLKNSLLDSDASAEVNSRKIRQLTEESMEHNSTVSTTSSGSGDDHPVEENPIRQVTDGVHEANQGDIISNKPESTGEKEREEEKSDKDKLRASEHKSNIATKKMEIKPEKQSSQMFTKVGMSEPKKTKAQKQIDQTFMAEARVRHLKDQVIRAKVYLSLAATRNNPQFIGELQHRMKETQKVIGDAEAKGSQLSKNTYKKLKAMEQTLAKGKQIQDDHTEVVKKLRAMIHSTEEQLRAYKKQTVFLTHLTTKTIPKGLHCLPLRLSNEYFNLNSSERQFPNQQRLEDPGLYHYALFSDNLLAAAVVVNSTVSNAKDSSNHVFHIVTDRQNYAAMRMWFLVNPPGKATMQVQNIEELAWLNSSYNPGLNRLDSSSMIDYYFRTYGADSDSNSKFRNPKYLSSLNHLRFYLPEIFPNLNKVVFLDDDIVVQKDLTSLWSLDLKGKVNGAVETCGGSFHRFNRYLNFSNPLIYKNFDPHACVWAFGMNIFDLEQWRMQNVTELYHSWQNLNQDKQLWKLGTLPPGLVTFWNQTHLLDHSWHVLGLGYNPNVKQKDIKEAAVIHYNGDSKPWLEIGIPEYRSYWEKFIDYNHAIVQECNINPLHVPRSISG